MSERVRPEYQSTDTILMVSPLVFGLNFQTLESNPFQNAHLVEHTSAAEIETAAVAEFKRMVEVLTAEGIRVIVCPSRTDADTPDSLFPNNWISFHPDTIVIYPMLAPNRRLERQLQVVQQVLATAGVSVSSQVLDLTTYEDENLFLEGTGSLVLDRENRVAFANLSPRTTQELVDIFDEKMDYEPIVFHAHDKNGQDIYHTNVVMSVGKEFAVICLDAITDKEERAIVVAALERLHKEIIDISFAQLYAFCGNILQVKATSGEPKIVMSQSAFAAFTTDQKQALSHYGKLVPVNIPTVEGVGGGSARCMMAEVFPSG